jgi:hypothetical protein
MVWRAAHDLEWFESAATAVADVLKSHRRNRRGHGYASHLDPQGQGSAFQCLETVRDSDGGSGRRHRRYGHRVRRRRHVRCRGEWRAVHLVAVRFHCGPDGRAGRLGHSGCCYRRGNSQRHAGFDWIGRWGDPGRFVERLRRALVLPCILRKWGIRRRCWRHQTLFDASYAPIRLVGTGRDPIQLQWVRRLRYWSDCCWWGYVRPAIIPCHHARTESRLLIVSSRRCRCTVPGELCHVSRGPWTGSSQ